jgi:hypothetical protein
MNRRCTEIEPLLYSHRAGELTADEEDLVRQHVKTCAQCAKIVEELRVIDATLQPIRTEPSGLKPGRDLVRETMAGIGSFRTKGWSLFGAAQPTEWIERLRAGLAFGLTALAVLFIFQEVNDAVSVVSLEQRVHEPSAAAILSDSYARIRDLKTRLATTAAGARAEAMISPSFFSPRMFDLFKKRQSAIEKIAERYPELSTVNADGPLTDRERNILATEGKAFLKDVELFVQKGDR